MSRPHAPCRTCSRRAPGCHDPKTCPDWGRFQADLAKWRDAYQAATVPENDMIQYDKRRRRAARARANRKD